MTPFNFRIKRFAMSICMAATIAGCDGGSALVITDDAGDSANNATMGSSTSVAIDTAAVEQTPVSRPSSSGDDAATLIAESTALGPVKIMAVGDSITHGVAGAASYRREFSALMDAGFCEFTMVGSQTSSRQSGGDSSCEDTGVIGDGWGWDGTKSCWVDAPVTSEAYLSAHEGYGAHQADHFLTGYSSSSGDNAGIRVAMESYLPDVVLLHIGSVDMYREQTVDSTLEDINNVLDTIYETKANTLVLIANIIPWYSDKPYPEIGSDVELLGSGVEQLVAEREDSLLKLVDVRSGYSESMMMSDLVHPNIVGEAHVADAFMSVYQPLANCSQE